MSDDRSDLFAPLADADVPAGAEAPTTPVRTNTSGVTSSDSAGDSTTNQTPPKKSQNLLSVISELKAEQKRMRDEKKALSKDLKNAQRKKRRLQARARQLSNDDLLTVLLMRDSNAAESEAGSGGAASSSSAAARTQG
jgi:molecular chaperone GrpE (heat shock protein)